MATQPAVEPATWGRALADRRFRTILLLLAGVPIVVAYLWYGVIHPLLSYEATDFVRTYMAGARMVAAGKDPYLCNVGSCGGFPHYLIFYPPFVLWAMTPLVGLNTQLAAGLALLATNLFLLAFVWLVLRALDVRDWQFSALTLIATISFAPTLTEVQNRNLQVGVLALSALFLLAYCRGDRWWGGAALGLAIAVKLIQAPLVLLALWGRRWTIVAASAVTGAILWLVGAPQYLLEYLFKIAPAQAQGSAEVINAAPFGTVNRLLHPESLYNSGLGGGPLVLAISLAIGLAVLLLTALRLRTPRTDAGGRALEVAVAVAASPLLVTLVYAGQFVLLLLPMIVLAEFGFRTRSRGTVLAVGISWLLLGPSFLAFTNAMANGFGFPLLFLVWANSPILGTVVLWLTSLGALAPKPSHVPRALSGSGAPAGLVVERSAAGEPGN